MMDLLSKNLTDVVREGHSKKYGKNREKVNDEVLVRRFSSTREGAKERGVEFNLTLKRLRQILNTKRCQYTGLELYQQSNEDIRLPSSLQNQKLTLERIDSTKGYTDDNVIAVASLINTFKANLNAHHIIKLAKKLERMGFNSTSTGRKIKTKKK